MSRTETKPLKIAFGKGQEYFCPIESEHKDFFMRCKENVVFFSRVVACNADLNDEKAELDIYTDYTDTRNYEFIDIKVYCANCFNKYKWNLEDVETTDQMLNRPKDYWTPEKCPQAFVEVLNKKEKEELEEDDRLIKLREIITTRVNEK